MNMVDVTMSMDEYLSLLNGLTQDAMPLPPSDNQGESSIETASTRQLMAALLARNDIDDTMKALLLQILTK